MKQFYILIAVVILLPTATFAQSTLDSILTYNFSSASDSTLGAKQHFDTYDTDGNLIHKVAYKYDNGERMEDYTENWEYTEGILTAFQKIYENHVDDYRVEYSYDEDGNLTEEKVFSNKNEGEYLDPEWERALKKVYTYNDDGLNDTIVVSAFVKYWQPARKIANTYDNGKMTIEKVYKWFPETKIKEFEGVYGQNPGATSNYLYRAYKIEQTVKSLDELAEIYVPAATTVVNVFKADGTRFDITNSPGGKSLKDLLTEAGITDIDQLRDNYREWFKTVEDDNTTLIELNIKAGTPFDIQEVIITHADLYTYNETNEFGSTIYWVKGAATMDNLSQITIDSDIDWLNFYIKANNPDGKKYERIDITGDAARGKTLKEILEDAGYTVSDLYQDLEKIFYDKDNNRKLYRFNVNATKVSPTENTIDVYKKLYAKSDDNQFVLNAYKVNSGATDTDLSNVTISDDAEKVTVYKTDGTNVQIYDDIKGKTLSEIFKANSLSVSDLIQDRVEWFYTSKGEIVLLNMNVKEEYNIGSTSKVDVTEKLYNIGTNEGELIYENTAFHVHDDATDDDLKNYSIPDNADYIIVYRTLNRKDTYDATPYVGKTLSAFLTAENLTISSLKQTYWEWFVDTTQRRNLVKLNIKTYREIQPIPIAVVDSLYTGSQGKVFTCTTYLVAKAATDADLNAIALPEGLQYIDYYANNSSNSLHPVSGIATLGDILKASGNTEGIDLNIDTLRENYVEWFINNEGKTKLYKINLKAVIQVNNGDLVLTKGTSISYDDNGKIVSKQIIDNYDNPSLKSYTKFNYTLQDNEIANEEKLTSNDEGLTWDKDSKKEFTYNEKGVKIIAYYKYTSNDLVLETKDFYFYKGEDATGIEDKIANKTIDAKFYPNPVGNTLNIHVQDVSEFTYKIYSMDGALIRHGISNESNIMINVSSLKSGIYIMNIISDKKVFSTKIAKK